MAMIDEGLNEYLQLSMIQHFVHRHVENDSLRILDSLGFRTGYSLIERMFPDTFRLNEEVNVMKYICKEFWISMFGKQIDNLRTNNSGIFVLQDNNFKLLGLLTSGDEANNIIKNYMAFTCGLIRGALSNFGYSSLVTYDIRSSPSCKFQINFIPSPAQSTSKSKQ